MISRDTLKIIEDKVKQIIEPLGFDLVEIKSFRVAKDTMIKLLVDRQEGGITLQECSQLNNRIGQWIDEQGIISESYTLEVSSPGLDRDLTKAKDFKRVLNKTIHVYLKEEQNGKMEFESNLVNVDDQGIYIMVGEEKQFFIPFTKINMARQVVNI